MSTETPQLMPRCPWCVFYEKKTGRASCARHPDGDSVPPVRGSLFGWASIAGANPEPVEFAELGGEPCIYTFGCQDAFLLSDPSVTLYTDELKRPKNLLTQDQVNEKEIEWRLQAINKHSWRGPR